MKGQPEAEPVLAAAVPKAKQFVRLVEGVLLLFAEEAQIPLDVVHLRADPPFQESFFECHGIKGMRALLFVHRLGWRWLWAEAVPKGRTILNRVQPQELVLGKIPSKAKMIQS